MPVPCGRAHDHRVDYPTGSAPTPRSQEPQAPWRIPLRFRALQHRPDSTRRNTWGVSPHLAAAPGTPSRCRTLTLPARPGSGAAQRHQPDDEPVQPYRPEPAEQGAGSAARPVEGGTEAARGEGNRDHRSSRPPKRLDGKLDGTRRFSTHKRAQTCSEPAESEKAAEARRRPRNGHFAQGEGGTPGGIRTHDLRFRKPEADFRNQLAVQEVTSSDRGANSGSDSGRPLPDLELETVVAAWPRLSQAVKTGLAAIVRAMSDGTG